MKGGRGLLGGARDGKEQEAGGAGKDLVPEDSETMNAEMFHKPKPHISSLDCVFLKCIGQKWGGRCGKGKTFLQSLASCLCLLSECVTGLGRS